MSYTLYHGDYRKKLKLEKESIDACLSSPPYNIGSKAKKKLRNRKAGEYDAKSYSAITDYADNLPEEEYQQQQIEFIEWCAEALTENGVLIYNHKDRHKDGRLISPLEWIHKQSALTLRASITWDRLGTHNFCKNFPYHIKEEIYILSKNKKYYFKNADFPGGTRKGVPDVWRIPKVSKKETTHNAAFPLKLAEHCVRLWCPPSGTLCDAYSGSGTAAVACYNTGRNFVGAENLKKYVKMAVGRAMKEGFILNVK